MAEYVACSVCEIIDTQNASGICARCTNRPHEHHGFSLGRILTDLMGREFSVFVKRSPASDSVRIAARCHSCRVAQDYVCAGESFRHYLVHDRAKLVEGFARDWKCNCEYEPTEATQLAEATCDPMERMVDGLTVAECLARFTAWQREDVSQTSWARTEPRKPHALRAEYLTIAQAEAARSAWSAALRAKQEEARERERRQIVCDDDRWEVG